MLSRHEPENNTGKPREPYRACDSVTCQGLALGCPVCVAIDALMHAPEPDIIAQRKAWTLLAKRIPSLRIYRPKGELATPPNVPDIRVGLLWALCDPETRNLVRTIMCELDSLGGL